MKKINFRNIYLFSALIFAFPTLMDFFPDYSHFIGLMVFAGLYSLITIGLSLFMGYTGQISLGHAAFFGIGAYSSAILTTSVELNPWLAMLLGMLASGLIALLVGGPSLKLKGHYLAMATLAFGIIFFIIFNEEIDYTGGPDGMDVPLLTLFDFEFQGEIIFYYLVWTITIAVFIFSVNLIQSRVGRALRAIHAGEPAAAAMGINVTAYKIKIFVFSAVLASLAGSLFGHYMEFVSPASFSVVFSIELLIMLMFGGIHHIWGAIIGAIIVTFLSNEFLHAVEEYETLVFGGILLVLTIYLPDGLTSLGSKLKFLKSGKKTTKELAPSTVES